MSSSHRSWEKSKSLHSNSGTSDRKRAPGYSNSYMEDEDDDDSCGFICFAMGVILLFAGVAVLATVLVYSQSSDSRSHVVSLTSSRPVKYVSEHLLHAIEDPNALRAIDHSSTEYNKSTKLLLLIIIRSLHNHPQRRMDIRNTWMKNANSKDLRTLVRFAVPAKDIEPAALSTLREESKKYKDMVIFEDCAEAPESEGLLFELIWANKNYEFSYLMKTRDTVYIRVPQLIQDVVKGLQRENSNAYLGYFEGKGDPRGDEKLKEPDWFLCDNYIRFAHSGGYILSRTLVLRLLSQAEFLHPYNNEDVAMGTWLSPFKDIDWYHNIHFDTNVAKPRGCKNDLIVFLPESGKMVATHERLMTEGLCCEKEFENVQTYTYNFETLPSKCCSAV